MEGKNPNSIRWIWCILIALPSLIPLAMHFWFAHQAGEFAIGFIQNDQPYYMANAREHFDSGDFSLTFSNPNDWREDSPQIYVQPQSLVLGTLRKITGLDPAILFNVFGFIFAVLTIRVAWHLLVEFLPEQRDRSAVFLMFMWGGGLFAIAGVATRFLAPQPDFDLYDYLTMYDPFQGWWFLNLGRNLIFPLEAYYHFLFFWGMLKLVQQKHLAALAIGLLISVSHPFTGVEYLSIAALWLFLERTFWKQSSTKWSTIIAAFLLLGFHLGYYQVWLNQFPSHRELHEVWELAWEYKAIHMILGYGLVAAFAIWRLRDSGLAANFLSKGHHRLILIWFLCAFLLANHEFFMKSTQPLHFTRGYVWAPLFLAGAFALQQLISFLNEKSGLLVLLLMALFLFDNASWLCICSVDGRHNSAHHQTNIHAVMKVLDETAEQKAVVVSNSRLLSYLSTVYTRHDAFVGHGYLTPNADENWMAAKSLFDAGEPIEILAKYRQLVLLDLTGDQSVDLERVKKAYETNGFEVVEAADNEGYALIYCVPASDRQQLGKTDQN